MILDFKVQRIPTRGQKGEKEILIQKIEKMEKFSLDRSREEKLTEMVRSFPVLYDKSHKGFKEKDPVKKMHGMELQNYSKR